MNKRDKVLNLIIGSQDQLSLSHRVFNTIAFSGTLIAGLMFCSDILLGLGPVNYLFTLIATAVFLCLYILSRRASDYSKLIAPLIVAELMVVIYAWYMIGGVVGSSFSVALTFMVAIPLILEKNKKYIVISIFFSVLTGLLVTELLFPELIHHYKSPTLQMIDTYVSSIFLSIGILFCISLVMKNHNNQYKKINSLNNSLSLSNRSLEKKIVELGDSEEKIKRTLQEKELLIQEIKLLNKVLEMKVKERTDKMISEITQRKEAEKKYKEIFDSSLDSIQLIDEEHRYLDCNQASLNMFMIDSKESLKRMTPVSLSPKFQPDGVSSKEKAGLMIEKAKKDGSHFFEWRHKRMNGEEFDSSVLLGRIEIDGEVVIQGTVRDISDQKQAQEMLIQSEKMVSVGGLAAGMAHEINNPLAGVIQNTSVLINRLTNKDISKNVEAADSADTNMDSIFRFMESRDILKMLNSIYDSGMRMTSIVENMLSFARKSDSSFSSYDPVDLVENTLIIASTDYDLKKKYDFKSITIERSYEDNIPMVSCEGSKIQQVLLNIFHNGAHSMFESNKNEAPKFIVRVANEKAQRMLRIEIEDNGTGIEKQISSRIFEPFFTTKPVGVGTGLGMSVSYFIIKENHKGTMEVKSSEGQGANFIIRIPFERNRL